MKIYTHSNPQIVLVVTDDQAAFEYLQPHESTAHAIRRAGAAIKRRSPDCFTRTKSLDAPPLIPDKHPDQPDLSIPQKAFLNALDKGTREDPPHKK